MIALALLLSLGGIEIKSGATADLQTVDPTSKAARVTLYSSAGSELSSLPVTGTLTCNAGTGTLAVSLASVPTHAVTLASTTITGSVATTGPVTDAQLRATPLPVSGSLTCTVASTTITGSVAVTGPLTDAQIRATALPVSGALTCNAGSGTMAVSLATAPSTPVTGTFWQAQQPVFVGFDGGFVSISNFPATQAVSLASVPTHAVTLASTTLTGTSAVSLATLPALTAGSAVIGHVISDTGSTTAITGQPAVFVGFDAGFVSVANFPASQAVTGTFFQATQPVSIASMPSTPVTGTFWQATQPISGTVAVSGQPAVFVGFDAGYVSIANFPATQPVSGTVTCNAGSGTLAVSLASAPTTAITATALPLPGGAATAAKQPALGTAGSASADVLTIQGVASMTALKVDGSAVTQPVNVSQIAGAAPTLKAASTAPVATDTALVVVQSPNGGNPCQNPSATVVGISGATSGTASVQLVALSGSTKIYVCSMNITGVSGTTPTFALRYGTGAACATGPVTMIGAWTTAASTVYSFGGVAGVAVTTAGQALCYIQTGTTPISNYNLTYVQI